MVKVRMPLKKGKEKGGAPIHRPSVKSDGLVKKNLEDDRNQDEEPGPSNSVPSRPSRSKGEVSTVSSLSVSDIEIGPAAGITKLHEEELEQIFGFLSFTEVKSARLVNKYWRQVATSLLRRSSKIIDLSPNVFKCITDMGDEDEQFPVNRLRVRLFAFSDIPEPEKTKTCLTFFPGICSWVKELTLSVHINRQQVLFGLPTFPTGCVYKELTHFNLQLYQRTPRFRKSWERIADFVRSILEKSPNLREINIGYEYSGAKGSLTLEICPLLENIFSISNSIGTSKLKCIDFQKVPLEKVDLASWSTLNLKLRNLGLNVSRCSDTNELIARFLETQRGSLQQLTLNLISWECKASAATFAFPRLEKLEQLRVICDLKEDRATWKDFGNDVLEPTNTMEELRFRWSLRNRLTSNPAIAAAQVFTGLKKLEVDADAVLIKAVYENMPNLEVLTFYSSSSETYDDIITGLRLEVCRGFRGSMTKKWVKKLQKVTGQSMACLKNLKTLKMSDCGINDALFISRLSFHVFKKMSSLECLDLFDGCAASADRYSADEDQEEFMEELRTNFVVL